MKKWLLLFCFSFSSYGYMPLWSGYINLSPTSKLFKEKVVRSKKADDLREIRTPSEILYSFCVLDSKKKAVSLDLKKLAGLVEEIKNLKLEDQKDEVLQRTMALALENSEWALEEAKNVKLEKINEDSSQDFLNHFFNAIILKDTLLAKDYETTMALQGDFIINLYAFKNVIKPKTMLRDRSEAANILIPEQYRKQYPNSTFFNPEDLVKLSKSGVDISQFDPPDSPFWIKQRTPVSQWDERTNGDVQMDSLKKMLSSEEISDLMDPEKEISFKLNPNKDLGDGTTPKVYGSYGDKKLSFKIKFITDKYTVKDRSLLQNIRRHSVGSEVNILPVVNNLAGIMGFNVEPYYFKKKIRLYFPDQVYEKGNFSSELKDFKEKLEKFFHPSWEVGSVFKEVKTDTEGKPYIEMKVVSLRPSSKDEEKLGIFSRDTLGRTLMREVRAFAIFQLLIQDQDPKNGNAKTKLLKSPDEAFQYSNSDMGSSLGMGFPNQYNPQFVVKKNLRRVTFNTRTYFNFPIANAVNFTDGRWLIRLLSEIPRDKIENIFRSAGYPLLVAKYFTEIFLHRVDQLAESVGMIGVKIQGREGEVITVEKRSKIKNLRNFSIPGYEKFFKRGKLEDAKNLICQDEKDLCPYFINWSNNKLMFE